MATSGIFRGKITGHLFAANELSDKLTRIAQGFLCLPSVLGNFLNPVKSKSALQSNIGEVTNIVTDIVRQTMTSEINRLRGYINYFIDDKQRLLREIGAAGKKAVEISNNFRSGIKNSVDFVHGQENCTYAASEMLSCIIQNSKSQINNEIASNIRSEISPLVTEVGDKLSGVDGAIGNYIDKSISDVKYYQEAQSFIRNLS